MLKKVLSIIALLLAGQIMAQQNNCLLFDMNNRESAFQSGEKLTYTLSYIVMGTWINVGEVEFITTQKQRPSGAPYYHIEVYGKTFPFFDRIFKVRDYFATMIDAKTMQPFYMERNVEEGSYRRKSTGRYNWANNVIYTSTQRIDKGQPVKYDTLPITPCTFDIVSLFYYYRNSDFSTMREKRPYNVQLVMDDKVYNLNYRLQGREEQRLRNVGRFNTLKFSASVIAGEVFSGNEQVLFWVTDDDNRIPVYMEVPIRVGSVRARLKSWENLKHPLSSMKN